MRRFIAFGPALVVLTATLVALVAAPAAVRLVGYARTDVQIRQASAVLGSDDILHRINAANRAVADKVEPSVVHIGVDEIAGRRGWVRQGQGSGWVFDERGHVVTNAHVVRGAQRITVQFQDGRQSQAELIGQDPSTDIAVIKVRTEEGLFPAERATGSSPRQGDRVFAFGSPFGFKFSMSEGIVSGLGRDPQSIIGQDGYTNFIQTDAAVNPGNSGGPLVDVDGRVIGMNVAIATARQSGGTAGEGQSAGISFAIPLPTIEAVVSQLIAGRVVTRGLLGISHPFDNESNGRALAEMGFRGRGVIVTEAPEDGPAARAGIMPGDIITRLSGQEVRGVPELRSAITNNRPGDVVDVEVWRRGERMTFAVELAALPPRRGEVVEAQSALERFGIAQWEDTEQGVAIAALANRSPALRAGFRPGQLVAAVNGARVRQGLEMLVALAGQGLQQGREVTVTVVNPDGRAEDLVIDPTP